MRHTKEHPKAKTNPNHKSKGTIAANEPGQAELLCVQAWLI